MKTVIEMAREIADPEKVDPWDEQSGLCVLTQTELERLVDLVRADERNSWPAEMEAMERQVNILTDALAEQPAPVQQEPDKHQEYIDSLSHDYDSEEKMLTQIHHWARQSYSRHQQSVRGQMITAADSSDNHIIWAALRWAKENPSPQAQRTWVGLMRGVRVEGDTVVITVKGGNDAARELCGALLEEKNT